MQTDRSSLGVYCPTTGTLIMIRLILPPRKDLAHLLQVHPCAILRLLVFFMRNKSKAIFYCPMKVR